MRFFLVFLLFTSCSLFAQKEGNIWYFGENAGIDFNSGTPVALTNGQIDTKEGCAAISNASGYLLFYTDGMKVYNRAHNQMPNGDNLDGNSSATSSGVIVPRPGSTNLFYILTIDAAENDLANGLRYSIVDLNSDGGMGDVTTKNILLSDNMTEKITAVAHCNGTDIWVITHKFGSSTFYIYKITTSGLMTSPTTQTIGLVHEDDDANHFNALGQIKSSIDGTRIAVAIQGHDGLHYVQLFDFDNNTGILSNTITLNFEEDVYGIEFSPDNRYLYADHRYEGELYQFDLSSNNQTTIQNSRVLLGTITDDYTIDSYNAGALQLAPDGKIYVARHMSKYLGVIANPNGAGSACNFSETGFYLGGKKSKEGLPTFIQSYFYKPELNYGDTCLGHATWFQFNNDNPKIDSIRWNFGDPASGAQNTSNSYQTSHIFTSTGTYTVRLYYYICNSVITITKNIKIIDVPVINLGPDTLGCTGITIDLSSPYTGCSYNWSNGSHALSIHVNGPGTYWLQATNSCGSDVDTVIITFADPPTIYLPGDTEICETEAYILDAGSGFYSYQWSTGSTSQTIQPTATGTFEVTVTDNNFCKGSASTFVDINMQPYLELGDDLEICENTSHTFHPYTNCHHYLW
ncbi:MAG: hypothetical protein KKA07_17430, partial [Bacteroidetes bacterium]|nr:hypothetical protein [Bacteroidota bacterium]